MTCKTPKTILFASLIVAMILPFNAMNYATAQIDENNRAKDTREQTSRNTE
jgi:hypothetical protein